MTKSFQSSKLNAKNRFNHTLQIEGLENRELLSVVPPLAGDLLDQSIPAFTSTINPADSIHNAQTNQNQSVTAPFEVELDTPLMQAVPTPTALAASATDSLVADEPLVVNLETPQESLTLTPDTPADLSVAKAQEFSATSLNVSVKSNTSNKVNLSWKDIGVESYTVQYRNCDIDGPWTTKVVKGKTNLSISVKSNALYEFRVTPQGMDDCMEYVYGGALKKLSVKVVSQTDNSISFQIPESNIGFNIANSGILGIKAPNEKSYTYYEVYPYTSNGRSGALSYSFENDILTIKGLSVNTKYSFQFAQARRSLEDNIISPYTNLSASTTKLKTKKFVVNTVDDAVNNDKFTSLREAIEKATDGAVITFSGKLKGQTIYLNSSLIINKQITIDASSFYDDKTEMPGLQISMTSNNYSIIISGSNHATIKGIDFISASGRGSAIYCSGVAGSVFNIQKCYFRNQQIGVWFDGSATSAVTNIDNCIFDYISNYGLSNASTGRMNVTNCEFYDCSNIAISNTNKSSIYVSQTSFDENYRCCNNSATAEFERCTFEENTESVIYNSGSGQATFTNVLVLNNDLEVDGMACFTNKDKGRINIFNMTSAHNKRTFRNDGSSGSLWVDNSVCSAKDFGSNGVTQFDCITFAKSELDRNYRPTASSPCVDVGLYYMNWTEKDLAGNSRLMGAARDIGCYEFFSVESRTSTSGKTTIYWSDAGASSYTVQYRLEGTENWTTKTVKNSTQLTIPVKNNVFYEVKVTPKGTDPDENSTMIRTGSLAKLGMQLISKTNNSVSYKISNIAMPEMIFRLGIKLQNENSYKYYDNIYRGGSGYLGSVYYTFERGDSYEDAILTFTRLNSNTKYDFQLAQIENMSIDWFDQPSYAISTFSKVSVMTAK